MPNWSSGNNAVLIDECQALGDVTVNLAVSEDLVTQGNGGFSLQLNAYPMPGVTSVGLALNWIQFTLYVSNTYGNNTAAFQWQAWALGATAFPPGYVVPPGTTNPNQPVPPFPQPNPKITDVPSNQLPTGSSLTIALTTDPSSHGVTAAKFTVQLAGATAQSVTVTFPGDSPNAQFPIGGFQVNLVGPGDGSEATFTSGAGELTYSVGTGSLSVQNGGVGAVCGQYPGAVTGETSNVVYGAVSPSTGATLSQPLGLAHHHLEVFWIDAAGNISQNWRDDDVDNGQWHQPFSTAIPSSRADSPLVAISRYPSHLEVFWIDAAGNISSAWHDDDVDNGQWQPAANIALTGSRADSPLVAISRYPSHLEVLWIDAAGNISQNWRDDDVDNGQWHQPFSTAIPSSRADSPLVAISRYPSHLEVFWIDAAGNISSAWRDDDVDNGQWQPAANIALTGSRADSPLVAISRYPSHLEVFWIDAAGNISSAWRDDDVDNGQWQPAANIALTGSRADSPLVAISRYPSHLEVLWIDAAGNISSAWRDDDVDNGQWQQPSFTAIPSSRADSPLVAISRYPSHLEVFWIDAAGNISSAWRDDDVDNGQWQPAANIALTGSRASSPLVAISRY